MTALDQEKKRFFTIIYTNVGHIGIKVKYVDATFGRSGNIPIWTISFYKDSILHSKRIELPVDVKPYSVIAAFTVLAELSRQIP